MNIWAGILLTIIQLMILVGVAYLVYTNISSRSHKIVPGPGPKPLKLSEPVPGSPKAVGQEKKSLGTGLWVRNPGKALDSHYNNGLAYQDAMTYCHNNGAQLATVNDLLLAYNDGFEYCSAGWLADQTAGNVMQSDQSGCGTTGFNKYDYQNLEVPLAAYCVGQIPNTSEVGAYILLSSS